MNPPRAFWNSRMAILHLISNPLTKYRNSELIKNAGSRKLNEVEM